MQDEIVGVLRFVERLGVAGTMGLNTAFPFAHYELGLSV